MPKSLRNALYLNFPLSALYALMPFMVVLVMNEPNGILFIEKPQPLQSVLQGEKNVQLVHIFSEKYAEK